MKVFKKLIAVILTLAVLMTMTACHKKDEVALTIDGINITSALYMNALIECDMEAKTRVDEELSEKSEETQTEEVDYFAQTIDNMSYVDYVKAEALERCREYAFYQKLVDNKTISLTDEEKAEAEYYAEAYWSYYGYSALYEANGVSLETYKKAFLYTYYANAYFMHIYGEGGEKEIDAETIKKTMNDKYALVYTLSKTYEEKATDAEKAAVKATYEGYAKRLEKGEDFKKIYDEVNPSDKSDINITEVTSDTSSGSTSSENASSENTSSGNTSSGAEEKENATAKDSLASVIGDEDTNYASSDFDTIYTLKTGEVKVIENKEKTGVAVYKKLDINEDPYYLKSLSDEIRVVLKEEEYEKQVDEDVLKLTLSENTYSTNRFKVKKIIYPETNY